jgi:6-phosphogluconolactonase (cycloisomerase 2 family)
MSSCHLTPVDDLELIDGAVPTGLTAACWIVVTLDGHYLYTTDTGSGAIGGYHIDPFRGLTLLDADGITASTEAGSAPIDMAISDNGRFLYALSAATQTVSEFRIRRDGRLDPIETLTGLIRGLPSWYRT